MPMALLGPSARQQQSANGRGGNFNDPAAMSAGLGMQAYHSAAAPASHSQHAILAAAAAAAAAAAHNQGLTQAASGFYPANSHHPQQQPQQHHSSSNNGSNSQQPAQEAQPDRPIGYGAFGVVWYVSLKSYMSHSLLLFSPSTGVNKDGMRYRSDFSRPQLSLFLYSFSLNYSSSETGKWECQGKAAVMGEPSDLIFLFELEL